MGLAAIELVVSRPCDVDCDGIAAPGACGGADCDDLDPAIRPGVPDPVGDGVDQNCDGLDGEDVDGDGVPALASGGADCDDLDPSTYGEHLVTIRETVDAIGDVGQDAWR